MTAQTGLANTTPVAGPIYQEHLSHDKALTRNEHEER